MLKFISLVFPDYHACFRISIHLMLKFINPQYPITASKNNFNTSHVEVYRKGTAEVVNFIFISIHLMLKFIQSPVYPSYYKSNFNTSHVEVYPPVSQDSYQYSHISIHLMLKFIFLFTVSKLC